MSSAPRLQAWPLATALLLCLPALACAQAETEAEVREEAILRCYHEMGEFGAEAMNMCVEAEIAVARTLIPRLAEPRVARCNAQYRHRGWAMVGLCVERDRAAEEALAGYAPEHAALIEACRAQFDARGAEHVKACVDQQLESHPPRAQ
jgi:hypothetical protein